jgi:predicted DNA-binding transcriptional regulator AlpA
MAKVLNVKSAADYVALSKSQLDKMRCDGSGPRFVRLGRRCVRYRVEALDAWLSSREVGNTTEPLPGGDR